jgi:Flp pilus assembly pilin Flp
MTTASTRWRWDQASRQMTEQEDNAPCVSRRRRTASLTEYTLLPVIQLAAVTVVIVSAWINAKWTVLNSALP